FFLEETVRTLAEEGVVGGRPGAFQLRQPLSRVRAAASVRAVLTSRIDRLAPEDKELLQSAAVIGEDVPYAVLAMIADRPEHEVRRGLMRLCASELLQEMAVFPEGVYAFKHALTHEVAYASMLLANRTTLHARIVDAIERRYADRLSEQVERLAHHSSQ